MPLKQIELKDVNVALEAANNCSEALRKILKEAMVSGETTPEIFQRLHIANKHYDRAMARYIKAYKEYYNIRLNF